MIKRWIERHRLRVEVKLAEVLMRRPADTHFGYDLMRAAGVRPGQGYPALSRMLDRGWLADGWEDERGDQSARRIYWITPRGKLALAEMI